MLLIACDLNVNLLISLSLKSPVCLLHFLDLLSHLLFSYCQVLWTFSFLAINARMLSSQHLPLKHTHMLALYLKNDFQSHSDLI